MRILITGADGQLGSELCRVLGYETIIPMTLPEFDLAKPDVEAQIVAASPDLIIHAGAYTDVDGAEREPDKAMAVNAEGTRQIAAAASRLGVRLIYISTDYVFDGQQCMPYHEQDDPHPINQYGFSKWKGEQAVLASGTNSLIVRTAWLFGAVGKNFVKSIAQASQREAVLRVVDDQRGCPTFAEDLAYAIVALMTKDVVGVIHVTNRGHCSWYELARAVVREIGADCPVLPITTLQAGRLAKRPQYSVLSDSRCASLGIVLPEWSQALARFATGPGLSSAEPQRASLPHS